MSDDSLALALPPAPSAPVQQVRGGFVTAVAVQMPRSLTRATRAIEAEANLAGESFYYGWGAGKDAVEGPSVKLAMAAVRCYGNCSIEMLPLQETGDSWVFTAAFVDYETGFTLQRQFRQSKTWVVHGKLDAARKEDIRFQIGQSKAVRNVILNALPQGLIDRAMEAAKEGARSKLERFIAEVDGKQGKGKGIVHAVDLVLKGLAKHGVKEPDALRKLDVADRKAIDLDRLLVLRGDLSALDSGESRHEELYPPAKTSTLTDRLAEKRGEAAKQRSDAPKPEPERDPDGNPIFPDAPSGSLFDGGAKGGNLPD